MFWTSASGSGTNWNGGFGAPFATRLTISPPRYAVWVNPNPGNEEIDLGIDYYLGWPAPPPPPPPPPPTCAPQSPSADDQFYVNQNNNPVLVDQGGSASVNLILDGPWIEADHGDGAIGQVTADNLPSGSTPSTFPASADNSGHSYALMGFYLTVPPLASPGSYLVSVQATDPTSCVAMTTNVPVTILSCVPQTTCNPGPMRTCGAISDGCGGTVNCGACPSAQTCSDAICCPDGDVYVATRGACVPTSCPAGTSLCDATGTCLTDQQCNRRSRCQTVGALKQCQ